MADVSVRPATPDDADDIAQIQVDTWRTAYRDLVPAPVLAALSVPDAAQVWAAAIESPPSPQHRVLVALEQSWRVGFAALAPADDDDSAVAPGHTAALAPLLVQPRWGRRGHGSRLLAAVVDHARGDGITHLVAWVLEGDTPSREFLVSAGWAPDGLVRALDTGAGELREVRLHTTLQ